MSFFVEAVNVLKVLVMAVGSVAILIQSRDFLNWAIVIKSEYGSDIFYRDANNFNCDFGYIMENSSL